MLRSLACIALLLAVTSGLAPLADAGRHKAWRASPPPLKDCTRLNGRFGYYGNPWCTPAEQNAWDRAEARRLAR